MPLKIIIFDTMPTILTFYTHIVHLVICMILLEH